MKPDCIVGWDIGGAHVKAAVIRNDKVIDTMQFPCPCGGDWIACKRRSTEFLSKCRMKG